MSLPLQLVGDGVLPDGSTLLTQHELGTLDIWRTPSWEEIAAAEAKEQMRSKQP